MSDITSLVGAFFLPARNIISTDFEYNLFLHFFPFFLGAGWVDGLVGRREYGNVFVCFCFILRRGEGWRSYLAALVLFVSVLFFFVLFSPHPVDVFVHLEKSICHRILFSLNVITIF